MKRLLVVSCVSLGVVTSAFAQAVAPGWETDPTAIRDALGEAVGYQPPEAFRYPYVSTYYVKPTVTPDEDVRVGFFVTDFESSKIRFLDDSHRFTAYLEYRLRNGASKVLTLADLPSGDAAFSLGRLPVGEYEFRVWAKDAHGRESHRVIQDFRVVSAADLTIPADKAYRVTADDLAAYAIRNDGNLERVVHVSTGGTQTVVKEKRSDVPGYTVTVPLTEEGKVPYRAYEKATVTYDAGYDRDAVETNAVKTSQGLQRLIDDKAAAGFRKVILPAGTYRVSHSAPIALPDRFTLDLGEATVKLNPFAGEKCIVFRIASAVDAHLVGGTLEGDYWAHDYAGSDKDSEWVSGVEIGGDSWYSSVEGVRVSEITGYGGQNGIASDARGGLAFIYEYLPKFAAGGLDPKTGVVDAADTNRFTTDFKSLDFKDLRAIRAKGGRERLQICKYLGYQGIRTRSWQMTVAWYDANRAFLSSETAWQYREMWIPADAAYLRVSVEEANVEAANSSELVITSFRLPVNCAVRNCTFERCRCVGYAASAMRNMLFEGNFFTTSGEAEAKCAFDAEDGADQMQDVYFLGNVFRDNPINNSILTCAGHNFILERNRGAIHFWGRTHSPCVRSNEVTSATYYCDSRLRSGYARFGDNAYSGTVQFGRNDMTTRPDNWDHVIGGRTLDGRTDTFKLELGKAGRAVGCTFRGMRSVSIANAYACTFEACTNGWFSGANWLDVTVRNSLFKNFYGTNVWNGCHFVNSQLESVGKTTLRVKDCDFRNSTVFGLNGSTVVMEGCAFDGSTVEGNYWEYPASLLFRNCTIVTRDDKAFLRMGVYTVGDIGFEGCAVSGSKPLVDIHDLRWHNNTNPETTPDRLPGTITLTDTAWRSTATTVVRRDSGKYVTQPSAKPITVVDGGNAWPEDVTVLETPYWPTWSFVQKGPEDPEFDWYVSPSGSDTAAGTSRSAAFATVAKAAGVAKAGQRVGILAGTYELGAEIVVTNAIALIGAGWEKTVLRPAANKAIRCVTLDGGARLEGVTLTGGKSEAAGAGVWVKDGTVSWCRIGNNAASGKGISGGGVSFTSGRGAIDHCIVTGNTIGNGSWGGGIGGKTPAGSVLIDTCLVYGNEDKNGSGGGVGFQNAKTEITVRSCTITENKCSNGNGHGLYFNDCSTGANLVLVNTILSGNVSGTTECNVFVARRYFDGTASAGCLISGTQEQYNGDIYKDAKVRRLFADASSVLSDAPTFVDAAGRDYHLARGSAGIRRGSARKASDIDLDGVAFAATPSVGCYEYAGLVEAPVFDPASGLTFVATTNVTLSCATEGATIRYTADGSDPTESSTPYAGRIVLAETTTIRAAAFKAGMEPSEIVSATYYRYTLPEPPVLGAVSVEARATTATLSGTIVSPGNNGASSCDVYLTVGTETSKVAAGVTDAFRHVLTGLSPETTYAYALSVTNDAMKPMGASAGGTFTTVAKSPFLEPVPGNPILTRQEVQQALDDAAAASPVGTVLLGEGVFEIDTQLEVKGGVTLKGMGWERTVIRVASAEATANTRCVTVGGGGRVVGVTLTGGRCTGAGAGALVKDGTVSWCCVSNNATTGAGTSGGGVSFTEGRGAVDHCIVAGNTITGGSWGAGIGGKTPAGPVLVDTCLVYGNEDRNGSGGGVGIDMPKTEVTLRRCTVTDNKCSNGNGHGVYFNNGKAGANLVLVNCLLSHNQAGTSECNLFVQTNTFDRVASSSCLVTGSQTDFAGGAIYKDAYMRNLIPRVLSEAPSFVDAARRDYRLAWRSPGVGAGKSGVGKGTDLDGRRYLSPPSVGCYEGGRSGLGVFLR